MQHNLGSDGRISPIRLKEKENLLLFCPLTFLLKLLFDLLFERLATFSTMTNRPQSRKQNLLADFFSTSVM